MTGRLARLLGLGLRAGRVVVGGLSPEAALKEAHKRIEDIHRIRSRG